MAWMKRWLTIVSVAVAVLVLSGNAGAHTSYCGHGTKTWSVWSYGQQIDYREVYLWSAESVNGDHKHTYRTQYAQIWQPWTTIHSHTRICNMWS